MHQTTAITVGGQSRPATSEDGLSALSTPVRSLYAHVPFCFHKCHYCDFYSFVDSQDRQPAFTDALISEIRTLARHARRASPGSARPPLDTVFVGGGTPSLLRPDLWHRLLAALNEAFDLSAPGLEFTVECNPETVTPELIATLRAGGVNRVSMGAQSFNTTHLKTLERWHDPENVPRALEIAAAGGIPRRSIDLIFAIPGQSLTDWETDLARGLSLCTPAGRGIGRSGGLEGSGGVEHISCYALTYEPNTAMTRRLARGEFAAAPDDLEARMYERTVELCAERGFGRYEVSNFAQPGAESRHNLAYWRQQQWLAAGPSASAHVAGWRWKNVPRLTDWMQGVERSGGYAPAADVEPPDPRRALAERLMMGVRIAEGLPGHEILAAAESLGARDTLRREAERQERKGLLRVSGGRWTLTDRGFLFADGVAAELMSVLQR
ncbi:MAG: coproporphyrinogen III oxidase family protein [Phycisphaerales bacterium]|nr:coproporphyrinogen III oxidase family protein [Phycisphaerales bacterium]